MKSNYEHQVKIDYVGRLEDIIPDIRYQRIKFDSKRVYSGTFAGQDITIFIEDPDSKFLKNQNQPKPPTPPVAYVASRTKKQAQTLARKIAIESALVFYEKAQEYLRQRKP